MKRISLGILMFYLLTEIVHAQSSVTLYGLVDAGFLYTNNSGGKKSYSVASGNLQANRWGLRGTEDLGGGLSTLFVLENGFSIVNGKLGQGGLGFGRQAYVGLSSNQYGTVTVGRQYDPLVDYLASLVQANQIATGYGAHPGDLDNMANDNRVNSAIKYASRSYSGLTFSGMYSLGGIAGQFNRNQVWAIGAGYNRGPLSVGTAYLIAKDPNFSYFGSNGGASTTASNMTISPLYSGYASAKTQQIIAVAGLYSFGKAFVGATYSNTQFQELGAEPGIPTTTPGGTAKFHNAEVSFRYMATPSFSLGVVYDYTLGYDVAKSRYHLFDFGADYFLSRATDLYAALIFEHASGTDSMGAPARAILYTLTPSSTANQLAAVFGIRHKF
jgi:predicted porin